MQTILNTAKNHLNEIRQSDFLVQALAELHNFDKALEYYLQLTGQLLVYIPEHFDIVEKYKDDWKKSNANPTMSNMIKEHEKKKKAAKEEETQRKEREKRLKESAKKK